MRQDCSPGSANCYPRLTAPSEREPFALNSSGVPVACPQYASSGCCTAAANSQLFLSFLIEENSLGEPSQGGCPACSANVQGLWCAFACSPQQSDFVEVVGLHNTTANGTQFLVNLTYQDGFASSVYSSCAGVGMVRGNPALSTAAQFLNYMGQQGVSTANTLVEFVSGGGQAGLTLPTYNCCSWPANISDPGATGNSSCPCASCLGSCPNMTCNSDPSYYFID